jgi:hypothetical protein
MAEGKALSNECSLCHQIIEQGPAGATEKSLQGLAPVMQLYDPDHCANFEDILPSAQHG